MVVLDGYPHTWTDDNRTPLFQFSHGDQEYGFFLFSPSFYIALLGLIAFTSVLSIPSAVLAYQFIVKKSASKFLLGYGILLPFWIIIPKMLADWLGATNILLRFSLCVITPTLSIFRTLEAMYDCTPKYARTSLGSFLMYFSFPILLLRDPKTGDPLPAPPSLLLFKLGKFFKIMFILGGYCSLFLVLDSFPKYGLGHDDKPHDLASVRRLFDPSLWMTAALMAPLFQLLLALYAEGLMITTIVITGKQTVDFSNNPLLTATSPSDFWGKRWNLTIHECLKGGVYKPIRKCGGSQVVAVFGAFLASGCFHEWLLPSVFGDFNYTHGLTVLFFLWQAVLVGGEALIGHRFSFLSSILPRPLRTMLLVLLGLPAAPWFMDCYWRSDFFVDAEFSLPIIRPL